MVCGMQVPEVSNAWWNPQEVNAKAMIDLAIPHTEIFLSRIDDEVAPPMLPLERDTTYTEYNEINTHEWMRSAAVPLFPQHMSFALPIPFPMVLDTSNTTSCAACSVASGDAGEESQPQEPTPMGREFRKLQKKLNTMSKLQERLATGEKLDPLQLVKLQKKDEVEREVKRVEQLVLDERKASVQMYVQAQRVASAQATLVDVQRLPAQGLRIGQPDQEPHMNAQWRGPAATTKQPPHTIGFQHTSTWEYCSKRGMAGPPQQVVAGSMGSKVLDCARLNNDLAAGGEKRKFALVSLRGHVGNLSFQPAGCRVVQQAIQVAGKDAVGDILSELNGHVYAATQSPYGNYVIQKVVEVLPVSLSGFVAEELRGVAGEVARHRYGCRILCRLFEHAASDIGPSVLADELIADASQLCRHTFAHHVMQAVFEHSLPTHRRQLVDALAGNLWRNAHDRCASYVIETGLMHCAQDDQQALAGMFVRGGGERIASLARSQSGNRILKALLKSPGDIAYAVQCSIQFSQPELLENRYGRQLLHDLKMVSKADVAA